MNFLEEKILADGVVNKGNVLKIDNFLNHQIDIDIMRQIAYEFKRRFKGEEVNKILTIEASGIAIATLVADLYDVPVVFAKKGQTLNSTDDKYISNAYSFTHQRMNQIFVSRPYLTKEDKVLIVDDFLADGEASHALIDLVKQAGKLDVNAIVRTCNFGDDPNQYSDGPSQRYIEDTDIYFFGSDSKFQ